MAATDMRMSLNSEIKVQADQLNRNGAVNNNNNPTVSTRRHQVNNGNTEWSVASSAAPGGAFQEHWPEHLPRPPSMKKLTADDAASPTANPNIPQMIVFNANTQEGSSMVRVLSERGLRVVAVVRVITSRNTKNLVKLKGVQVKVADLNNQDAVAQAAEGCQQAFFPTKYWERFENSIEEQMAQVVLAAAEQVGIKRIVLCTFEDTRELRSRNRKSQLLPTPDGLIYPNFEGMKNIDRLAKSMGITVTHMMTSYLDDEEHKKSLILIRGENGKIVVQPHVQDVKPKN